MKPKSLTLFSTMIILILVLGANGTKLAVAETIQATWGTPVDLPSEQVDQQTVEQAGEKYGAVILFHASSWSWAIQDLMNRAMSETVKELQDQSRTPLYVHAQVENQSCPLSAWCDYDVRVTVHYQTPQNQQIVQALIILAVVIAIIVALAYLVLTKIDETIHFIVEHPLEGMTYVGALGAMAVAVLAVVILVRRRRN